MIKNLLKFHNSVWINGKTIDGTEKLSYTVRMQTMVLISIFTDLLIKHKISRDALAKKYELSPRTITRYIDVLTKAGIPIESHSGLGGGYILPADYKLDRMLLTETEYKRVSSALEQTKDVFGDGMNERILKKLNIESETVKD